MNPLDLSNAKNTTFKPTTTAAFKPIKTCTKCRNHGSTVQVKGHTKECPRKTCSCLKCLKVNSRALLQKQKLSSSEITLRTKLLIQELLQASTQPKMESNNYPAPSAAAPSAASPTVSSTSLVSSKKKKDSLLLPPNPKVAPEKSGTLPKQPFLKPKKRTYHRQTEVTKSKNPKSANTATPENPLQYIGDDLVAKEIVDLMEIKEKIEKRLSSFLLFSKDNLQVSTLVKQKIHQRKLNQARDVFSGNPTGTGSLQPTTTAYWQMNLSSTLGLPSDQSRFNRIFELSATTRGPNPNPFPGAAATTPTQPPYSFNSHLYPGNPNHIYPGVLKPF